MPRVALVSSARTHNRSRSPAAFFTFGSYCELDMPTELPPLLTSLLEKEVVLDVAGPYVFLGRLVGGDEKYLALADADVHDLRDTATTREEYVIAARRHGVAPNRTRVFVRTADVVSISALKDVIA
jgi:hypothetical protein